MVPLDCERLFSDLTSVPVLFTWLVPRSGDHLPATLIHHGLVRGIGEPPEHIGAEVSRGEVTRVFRDAMSDAGTGVIRRWTVWTAVTLATMWKRQGTATNRWTRACNRWVILVSLFSIAWLGYEPTADLVNRSGRWPCTYELFWVVGDRSWVEFVSGTAGATSSRWSSARSGGGSGVPARSPTYCWERCDVGIALLVRRGIYVVVEVTATGGVAGLRGPAGKLVARWQAVATAAVAVVVLAVVCRVCGLRVYPIDREDASIHSCCGMLCTWTRPGFGRCRCSGDCDRPRPSSPSRTAPRPVFGSVDSRRCRCGGWCVRRRESSVRVVLRACGVNPAARMSATNIRVSYFLAASDGFSPTLLLEPLDRSARIVHAELTAATGFEERNTRPRCRSTTEVQQTR